MEGRPPGSTRRPRPAKRPSASPLSPPDPPIPPVPSDQIAAAIHEWIDAGESYERIARRLNHLLERLARYPRTLVAALAEMLDRGFSVDEAAVPIAALLEAIHGDRRNGG